MVEKTLYGWDYCAEGGYTVVKVETEFYVGNELQEMCEAEIIAFYYGEPIAEVNARLIRDHRETGATSLRVTL